MQNSAARRSVSDVLAPLGPELRQRRLKPISRRSNPRQWLARTLVTDPVASGWMTFRNSMGENCSYRGLLSGKISSQSRLLNGFLGFADWDQRLDEGGAMKTGLVKWFNARKGYGFIRPVDGGFDVYVHINEVRRAGWAELKEGQEICFETVWMSARARLSLRI
jgi:cold shock protein